MLRGSGCLPICVPFRDLLGLSKGSKLVSFPAAPAPTSAAAWGGECTENVRSIREQG